MKFALGNIRKLISVSVFINPDGFRFDALRLKLNKGEIEIVDEFTYLRDVEELVQKLGTNDPYILNFNGKGVLNREVENSENKHHAVLLNASTNDFYFTDYIIDNKAFVSVLRKQTANSLIENITALQGQVIHISSGPFLVAGIAEYLGESTYQVHDYHLTVDKGNILDFKKEASHEKVSYTTGDKRVSSTTLAALANGVQFFNPLAGFELPEDQVIFGNNYEEAKQKVIFKQFGFFMLGFFLLALLGNYLYISHLNNKFQRNDILLAEYGEDFAKIEELEKEKTRKESLLRASGVLTKKYISFYLAEIANSVPRQITFTRLTVKPVKKEIKTKHKIEIDNQLILINGVSKSSSYLSDWILDLKKLDWVNKVEIVDYEYAGGIGEFAIKIVI